MQDLVGAHAARIDLGGRMARFHETYDLLLTPQLPLEAFAAGTDYEKLLLLHIQHFAQSNGGQATVSMNARDVRYGSGTDILAYRNNVR